MEQEYTGTVIESTGSHYVIRTADGATSWSAYEVNTPAQNRYTCTVYTPAYGQSLAITAGGSLMTVQGGVITGFQSVSAGASFPIPADGYLVYMGTDFTSTNYFKTPVSGTRVRTMADR